MLLDIRKLFSHPEGAQPLSFSLDFSEADFPGYRAAGLCKGQLETRLEGHGSRLRLKLTAEVVLEAECARCLAPVRLPLVLARTMFLSKQADVAGEEDLPMTGEGKLDVTELIYTEILVTAPSVFLCDPECQGIRLESE